MVLMPQTPETAVLALSEETLLQQTDRLSLADAALRGQPWTETLVPDELLLGEKSSEGQLMIIPPLIRYRLRLRKVLRFVSSEGYFQSQAVDLHTSDVHHWQSPTAIDDHTKPTCIHFPLIFLAVPRKIFWLALLASFVISIIAAETPKPYVDVAVWVFGIMANVPSIYVLANPNLSSSGNGHTEDTIWKVARGWSVSFGPVFALVLVMLLRSKLAREKRNVFVILWFVLTTLGALILMLFTREGRWVVLDLLSICASWCAVGSKIIVEMGVVTAAKAGYGEQIGLSQRLSIGRHESEVDDHSRMEAGRASLQSDGRFTNGDDSTLGGRASHCDG